MPATDNCTQERGNSLSTTETLPVNL
jgi:hypothetical protein